MTRSETSTGLNNVTCGLYFPFLPAKFLQRGTYLLHSALDYSIIDSNMHLHHTEGIYTALTSSILGMTDFLALRYILQQLSEALVGFVPMHWYWTAD